MGFLIGLLVVLVIFSDDSGCAGFVALLILIGFLCGGM